ncbi:MAG: DUF2237 domain-containing protein [Gemmatimonadota bacterium]|nr:DUF2237 domain-containing protein [Gemmatimonadota bacterium]
MPTIENVMGGELQICCISPMTGFYRNGWCDTGEKDLGAHTVCVVATEDFLQFSRSMGNDLSTPVPEYEFPGLKPGDKWCLCADRWQEAMEAGMAPSVILEATHKATLEYVSIDDLMKHQYREE